MDGSVMLVTHSLVLLEKDGVQLSREEKAQIVTSLLTINSAGSLGQSSTTTVPLGPRAAIHIAGM